MPNFALIRHGFACADGQSSSIRSQECPVAFSKFSKQSRPARLCDHSYSHISAKTSRMENTPIENETGISSVVESAGSQPETESHAKVQTQTGGLLIPPTPSLTCSSESAGSCRTSTSSSLTSSSDEFDMPPTPKIRTCDLPMSPSIVTTSPLPSLRARTGSEEVQSEEPEFDPFREVQLLHPLADVWASLDRYSSLSLTAEPSDEETWPYNNSLGLYVDPAMNIATWDAAGFIRSTAPSPSPPLRRPVTRRT